MMTKSFHKLELTILAITIIVAPQVHADATDSSKTCSTYTADFKHLNKSLLTKQKLLKEMVRRGAVSLVLLCTGLTIPEIK